MKTQFESESHVYANHPFAFLLGTIAVIAGVLAHIPMYLESAAVNYHMAGMEMSLLMHFGMYSIVIGTCAFAYSLFPKGLFSQKPQHELKASDVKLQAMDQTSLSPRHIKLLFCLGIALIVDVMKPATLGFVVPGASVEYDLSRSQAALMPFAGILGTAMGSFIWGWLGDTIGRRAAILLAAMIFIGTSICGAMPSFAWNVFMCWLMGLGAGGMLPTTFALLSEMVPARQRGWLIVLLGGIGTIGGYLAASGFAALLEPEYGWRIMWFLGLPTGFLLILLNRYIPESPRYLIAHGRHEEADKILSFLGVKVVGETNEPKSQPELASPIEQGKFSQLFRSGRKPLTASLGLFGMAWGLVNFGFLLWLPMNLREIGLGVGDSDAILAKSALIALPSTVVAAWLYFKWSSKYSLALFALLSVGSLLGCAYLGNDLVNHPLIMSILLVGLLVSSSATIAMLSPYSAEVYPVHIRSTGSGWVAGSSKAAGVFTLGSVVFFGLIPGITISAITAAIATILAILAILVSGIETKGMTLESVNQ